MKAMFSLLALLCCSFQTFSQTKRIELSNLLNALIQDSTEYQTVGDWNLKKPNEQTIHWTSKKLEMSNDMSINFFKKALVLVTIKGQSSLDATSRWNLILRGARSGFDNFNLTSPYLSGFIAPPILDSILAIDKYKSTLIKSCTTSPTSGYSFYKIIFPKKIISFIKLAWEKSDSRYKLVIDCYDSFSVQFAQLPCK
ncbi:MAG: hypothetical protein JSS98_04760 [Bacteroidetes bacterium]|nr:hypothetical protein [Bacteroidota bacterium]